jgi:hypothetical protein
MRTSVEGVEQLLKNMENKLGKSKTNRVVNKALRNAGEKNKTIVKEAMSGHMDTGLTYDLVVSSSVKNNPKRVETGWASKTRAPLVHLSEFGYTRFGRYIRPRGMGKLQGAVDEIEKTSLVGVREDLGEFLQ